MSCYAAFKRRFNLRHFEIQPLAGFFYALVMVLRGGLLFYRWGGRVLFVAAYAAESGFS